MISLMAAMRRMGGRKLVALLFNLEIACLKAACSSENHVIFWIAHRGIRQVV